MRVVVNKTNRRKEWMNKKRVLRKLPFKWPISLVIWCLRLKKIIPIAATNEKSSNAIAMRTMSHVSFRTVCWRWCSSMAPFAEPLALGGDIKWAGSIVNATYFIESEKERKGVPIIFGCWRWIQVAGKAPISSFQLKWIPRCKLTGWE